jgi:hypothetical protein
MKDWVRIVISGQSFMLHQIRKMISLVLMIVRHRKTKNIIETAFSNKRINIPVVPGNYLSLNMVKKSTFSFLFFFFFSCLLMRLVWSFTVQLFRIQRQAEEGQF